jgi:hypothetical protein
MRWTTLHLLAVAATLLSCRNLQKVTAGTDPLFLGESSGIYRSVTSVGPLPIENLSFQVIEVDQYLILLLDADGGNVRLSFVSNDKTTASGQLVGRMANGQAGQAAVPDIPLQVTAATIRVTLTEAFVLSLGADATTAHTCADGKCYVNLQKDCDYDSTYSGVFNVMASCDDTAFANEQWIVSATSTGDAVSVLLDGDRVPRFAQLFEFDRATLTLSPGDVFPIAQSDGHVNSMSFSLADTDVTLQAQVTAGGDTREVCATRRKGARAGGIDCGSRAPFNCSTNISSCPALPAGVSVEYAIDETAQTAALGQLICPQAADCAARVPVSSLCDKASRFVAANGCNLNQVRVEASVSGEGGGNPLPCVKLSCDTSVICNETAQDAGALRGAYCGVGNNVALTKHGGCVRIECQAPVRGCLPLIDCDALGLKPIDVIDAASLCHQRFCSYGSNTLNPLALASNPYVIVGFDAQNVPILQSSSSPDGACQPIKLPIDPIRCPAAGTTLPQQHACLPSTEPALNVSPALGPAGAAGLCIVPLLDERMPIAVPRTNCAQGTRACCDTRLSDTTPKLSCHVDPGVSVAIILTPPAGPTGHAAATIFEKLQPQNSVTLSTVGGMSATSALPWSFAPGVSAVLKITSGEGCYFSAADDGASLSATGPTIQEASLSIPMNVSTAHVHVDCP